MPASDDMALWYSLHRLEVGYWYDVDFNHGRKAADFYVEDGIFSIGGNVFSGRERIGAFYRWREQRSRTTTRHVISNLQVFADDDRHARMVGTISFHQAEGRPPLWDSSAAILIADLACDCVLGEDGAWRFASHVLQPVFMGNDVPLSLANDLARQPMPAS